MFVWIYNWAYKQFDYHYFAEFGISLVFVINFAGSWPRLAKRGFFIRPAYFSPDLWVAPDNHLDYFLVWRSDKKHYVWHNPSSIEELMSSPKSTFITPGLTYKKFLSNLSNRIKSRRNNFTYDSIRTKYRIKNQRIDMIHKIRQKSVSIPVYNSHDFLPFFFLWWHQ